jgi:hypothetical protein
MKIWGDPVEYKGINLYPISMRNCMEFYDSVQCLMYEKNKIQDVQVIKMTYLDFLFALIHQENSIYYKLEKLLSLVLRNQRYEFTYDNQKIGMIIQGEIISGYEFEEIKKIILEQNLIQHEDTFLDPEIEKDLREAEEFLATKNGTPATLEERIIALHCLSGVDYSKIRNYTIFQFNKTLERFAIIKNFDVYSALMAENGASKDIQHWLSHVEEKGRYADAMMSKDEFDKLTADNGIINK